jgi:hypothetical protein
MMIDPGQNVNLRIRRVENNSSICLVNTHRIEIFTLSAFDLFVVDPWSICPASTSLSDRIDSPFLLPSEGRCLIENATQGVGTSEGENEETDQADFAPRSDGCN